MPKSKPKHGKGMLYIKTASMVDLARYAYNFDFTSKTLMLSHGKHTQRVIALGESIGDNILAYYTNIESGQSFIRYSFPSSRDEPETARFATSTEGSEKSYINIIKIDLSSFKEVTGVGKNDILAIKIESPEDLIHSAIKRTMKEESFVSLYAFDYKGKGILCGFDLIEELMDEKKTFYYAVLKDKRRAGFAKYSYANNTFEFTDSVGEHSYIYVKIINLAEPFPFFKMPD